MSAWELPPGFELWRAAAAPPCLGTHRSPAPHCYLPPLPLAPCRPRRAAQAAADGHLWRLDAPRWAWVVDGGSLGVWGPGQSGSNGCTLATLRPCLPPLTLPCPAKGAQPAQATRVPHGCRSSQTFAHPPTHTHSPCATAATPLPLAVTDLIKATPESEILRRDIYERAPMFKWSDGEAGAAAPRKPAQQAESWGRLRLYLHAPSRAGAGTTWAAQLSVVPWRRSMALLPNPCGQPSATANLARFSRPPPPLRPFQAAWCCWATARTPCSPTWGRAGAWPLKMPTSWCWTCARCGRRPPAQAGLRGALHRKLSAARPVAWLPWACGPCAVPCPRTHPSSPVCLASLLSCLQEADKVEEGKAAEMDVEGVLNGYMLVRRAASAHALHGPACPARLPAAPNQAPVEPCFSPNS